MDKQAEILIVDDDKVSAILLKEILAQAGKGYRLIVARSGQEALVLAEKEIPDLILLDVVLQDMEGFDVCRRIKANPVLKDVPVILVTALEKIEEKVVGFRAGACDYIVKPINAEETRMRVETHLKIKQYQDELKDVNEELKRTQAASIESAKMSAVGSLAAGVAHEFNNILALMKGFAQLQEGSQDLSALQRSISIMAGLIVRGEELVQGLLNFSRESSSQKREVIDIRHVLKNDSLLLKNKLEAAGIKLEMALGDEALLLDCYPNQLSQVFVNMALNAIEAMEESPVKELSVIVKKCAHGCDMYCYGDSSRKCESPNGCVVISIKDTGCGIPQDLQERIFEPFVTTKGVVGGGNVSRPGTGLGLSIAWGIVKRHKGFIFFNSKIGEGTEFHIVLPAAENL